MLTMAGCSLNFTYTLLACIIAATRTSVAEQASLKNPEETILNTSRPPWMTLPVVNPTKSFWTDTPGANPLAHEGSTGRLGFEDDDVDVCIIGSGITGISTLYHLQQFLATNNHSDATNVVVLEAREFCSGATGRNGGHLTRNPFLGYESRAKKYGHSNANKAYLLEDYVTNAVVDIIHSHNLVEPVDLVKGDHITLFFTPEEAHEASSDFSQANTNGVNLKGVDFLDRLSVHEKYGADYPGLSFASYNLWPVKFVSELYNLVTRPPSSSSPPPSSLNVKLHTMTPVTSITRSHSAQTDNAWNVHTHRGALTCKNVVHATNAYAPYLLPQFQDRIIPTRGQMIALRAKTSLDRLERHSWDANWGYEYWFPRPEEKSSRNDTRKPPLVMLGGGRDTAGPTLDQYTVNDSILNEQVGQTLREFLPKTFNGTGLFEEGREPEMEWTGIMGFTPDGVPVVGPIEHLEGQFIAAGFTGHGMPRTFAAAEAVAGMISAKLTGTTWQLPEWLPEHYLTTWKPQPL